MEVYQWKVLQTEKYCGFYWRFYKFRKNGSYYLRNSRTFQHQNIHSFCPYSSFAEKELSIQKFQSQKYQSDKTPQKESYSIWFPGSSCSGWQFQQRSLLRYKAPVESRSRKRTEKYLCHSCKRCRHGVRRHSGWGYCDFKKPSCLYCQRRYCSDWSQRRKCTAHLLSGWSGQLRTQSWKHCL